MCCKRAGESTLGVAVTNEHYRDSALRCLMDRCAHREWSVRLACSHHISPAPAAGRASPANRLGLASAVAQFSWRNGWLAGSMVPCPRIRRLCRPRVYRRSQPLACCRSLGRLCWHHWVPSKHGGFSGVRYRRPGRQAHRGARFVRCAQMSAPSPNPFAPAEMLRPASPAYACG